MEDPAITFVKTKHTERGLMTWKHYPELGGPLHSHLALETASTSCVTPSGVKPSSDWHNYVWHNHGWEEARISRNYMSITSEPEGVN